MTFDLDYELHLLKDVKRDDVLERMILSKKTIQQAILIIRKIYEVDIYNAFRIMSHSAEWTNKIIETSKNDRAFARGMVKLIQNSPVDIGLIVINGEICRS